MSPKRSPGSVDNSQLVFASVRVRHAFSPGRYVAFQWSVTLMDSSLPRNDGSPCGHLRRLHSPNLRGMDVKLVRGFHHPGITAINGLLATNAEGVQGTATKRFRPIASSQFVHVPKASSSMQRNAA